MSQNFFDKMRETENLIQSETDEEREQYGSLRLTALNEMKTAVISCAWCDTEMTRQMIHYINMRAVDVEKYYDISQHTVRSARSKASRRLYSMFGDNVFDGIITGDKSICHRTITLSRALTKGYVRIENFVPNTVIRSIERKGCCSENQYQANELREELCFLRYYNQIVMKDQLESLDSDKLIYIYNILKQNLISDDKVNMDKLRLLSKIIGDS
ncbi:MAG: hypothetical protein NC177_04845 [Ruminococcus flavefaciens]|nr:hypothetical protein [Ruminococcus flavefaciens]